MQMKNHRETPPTVKKETSSKWENNESQKLTPCKPHHNYWEFRFNHQSSIEPLPVMFKSAETHCESLVDVGRVFHSLTSEVLD